jgi:hypothetical protein
MPLSVMLGEKPKVGNAFTLAVFDPTAMTPVSSTVKIEAESLFTVDDSASYDSATTQWVSALRDTVRAWKLTSTTGPTFSGWVDGFGRIVEASQPGNLVMRRMAYELAFENWRSTRRNDPGTVSPTDDIIESTAIASNASIRGSRVSQMTVKLSRVNLSDFDLDGDRQILRGDTLTIIKEDLTSLQSGYQLPAAKTRFAKELAAEALIQANHPGIVGLAKRIAGDSRDPAVVAERLNRWVYDSLSKDITIGIPNALQVLRSRSGDCNEHTQLYLALARAVGLPARSASGLALVRDKFYYHAWPEVYLGRWIAVDPTFGQFPADAAHIRFTVGGLVRQADLLRLIGQLDIDVLKSS